MKKYILQILKISGIALIAQHTFTEIIRTTKIFTDQKIQINPTFQMPWVPTMQVSAISSPEDLPLDEKAL